MKKSGFENRQKPVAIWLLVGVVMIIIQIILGGITRLTDSGLSITEWQPILGAILPATDEEWSRAFEKYKEIAQFKHLHSYFTLEDFKAIYFWEWLHRVWGRFIGIVFIIPFIIFLIQRRFTGEMIKPFIILFLLGALQGLIGWIMVQSGLNNENLYVSHIRLAIHFILALILLVFTLWFALKLLVKDEQKVFDPPSRKWMIAILIILFFQLIYGALMAGLKAAPYAPTWPDINGSYFPPNMTSKGSSSYTFFSAIVNNPIAVHFIHRNLAYLLVVVVVVWTVIASKIKGTSFFNKMKWFPLFFVLMQATLGIATVLTSPQKVPQKWQVFEWWAQLHQIGGLFLLLSLVIIYFSYSRKENHNSSPSIDLKSI